MTDQVDALRAVVEAARSWAGQRLQLDEGTKLYDLREAVEALEATLSTEVVVNRMWQEQEPGNWVSPPGSTQWFEVTEVVPFTNDDGTVSVTIRVGFGKNLTANRPATVKVKTKTRTKKTITESAIEALSAAFPGTEIL